MCLFSCQSFVWPTRCCESTKRMFNVTLKGTHVLCDWIFFRICCCILYHITLNVLVPCVLVPAYSKHSRVGERHSVQIVHWGFHYETRQQIISIPSHFSQHIRGACLCANVKVCAWIGRRGWEGGVVIVCRWLYVLGVVILYVLGVVILYVLHVETRQCTYTPPPMWTPMWTPPPMLTLLPHANVLLGPWGRFFMLGPREHLTDRILTSSIELAEFPNSKLRKTISEALDLWL